MLSEGMVEMEISRFAYFTLRIQRWHLTRSPSHLVPPISFLTASEHPGESAQLIYVPDLFRLAANNVTTTAPLQSFSAALQSVPTPSHRDVPEHPHSPVSEASVPSLVPTKSSSGDSVEVIEWESVNKPSRTTGKAAKKPLRKETSSAKQESGEKALSGMKLDKVDADEWVEAGKAKVGKRWKGKGGKQVTSVRTLNPRPCHT